MFGLGEGEIYFDSATTSRAPAPVLDRVYAAYQAGGSPGRSVHARGVSATQRYASARAQVAAHLGVADQELVFVPSATLGLNLVAHGWGRHGLGPGDQVLVSVAEHNANFLPWQQVCNEVGAQLLPVACTDQGALCLEDLSAKLSPRTRVLALTQVSNVSGAVTDVAQVVSMLRASDGARALVVVDGAQGIAHFGAQPQAWGCDVYVFSGHKCYGVPGAGALWGTSRFWSQCAPLWVGGGSVEQATFEETRWIRGPARFESGTANLAAVQGMVAGLDFAQRVRDPAHAARLVQCLLNGLAKIPGIRVLGGAPQQVGCVSWVHQGVHAHDVGSMLASQNIAVRVGHHCAHRMLSHFGAQQCVRASFAAFNRVEEIEVLVRALAKIQSTLA